MRRTATQAQHRLGRHLGRQVLATLTMSALSLPALSALAGPGTDFLSGKVKAVRALVAQPAKDSASKAKVDAQLMAVVAPLMNFPKMSQATLGKRWAECTDAQRKRFVELFQELVFHSYMKRIRSANEDYSVTYLDEMSGDEGRLEVEAEAKTKKMEVELRFKLAPAQGSFEVEDVVIDEVSLVNNYREQFAKIIVQEGFDGLLKKMERQVQKLKGG